MRRSSVVYPRPVYTAVIKLRIFFCGYTKPYFELRTLKIRTNERHEKNKNNPSTSIINALPITAAVRDYMDLMRCNNASLSRIKMLIKRLVNVGKVVKYSRSGSPSTWEFLTCATNYPSPNEVTDGPITMYK